MTSENVRAQIPNIKRPNIDGVFIKLCFGSHQTESEKHTRHK